MRKKDENHCRWWSADVPPYFLMIGSFCDCSVDFRVRIASRCQHHQHAGHLLMIAENHDFGKNDWIFNCISHPIHLRRASTTIFWYLPFDIFNAKINNPSPSPMCDHLLFALHSSLKSESPKCCRHQRPVRAMQMQNFWVIWLTLSKHHCCSAFFHCFGWVDSIGSFSFCELSFEPWKLRRAGMERMYDRNCLGLPKRVLEPYANAVIHSLLQMETNFSLFEYIIYVYRRVYGLISDYR